MKDNDRDSFQRSLSSSLLLSFFLSFSKFAYFPLSQGQAVPKCMTCISDDSVEDCNIKAGKGVICPGENPVCAMYITTKELGRGPNQRFIRFCSSSDHIEILQEMCSLGPLFIPSMGTTTCLAYEERCSSEVCS